MHEIISCYISRWGTVVKKCYRRIATIGKYQAEFDPGRRELVSTCEKIKFLHKIIIKTYFKTSVLRFGTNLLEEGGYDVNCIWVKWGMTNAPC